MTAKENPPSAEGGPSNNIPGIERDSLNSTGQFDDFRRLLDELGHSDGEYTSLLYIEGDATRTAVMTPADALEATPALPQGADCYFGVNPVAGPARKNAGRGTAADNTRLAALIGDIDIKAGACRDIHEAQAIIAETSIILEAQPTVIVHSGGGLQAYWPILDGNIAEGRSVAKRFGRLLAAIADRHRIHLDTVSDTSRMLRIPGTSNWKTGQPRPVTATFTAKGRPLDLNEVEARLDEYGITPRPDDSSDTGIELSAPREWRWAETTCGYATKMIKGFRTDSPIDKEGALRGRNPWLLSQRVRLACAHRLGCITEADYRAADKNLEARFAEIVADRAFGLPRPVKKLEHRDTRQCAIGKAAKKTDDEARAELGGHLHEPDATILDGTHCDSSYDSRPKLWPALDLNGSAPAQWLAKGQLPKGAITLLIGDEGIGKSLFWVWLAVYITTGKPFSHFGIPEREPGHIIIVITEDDWATTVRPRLEVAGADLRYISVICTEGDGSGAPEFPRDLHIIKEATPTPALIVVDAWLDTVPAKLSVKDPQQARQALHPWKEVATTTGAAVLLVTHTNRVATTNARDKYGATGELRKKARMTLFAQRDEEAENLLIGPEKSNITGQTAASAFAIKAIQHFEPSIDGDGTVPQLIYAGLSEQTARQHLQEQFLSSTGVTKEKAEDAVAFLATYLASGPRWATDILTAADAVGLSEKKARTAKSKLAVKTSRATGNGAWFWALPQHDGLQPASHPDDPDDQMPLSLEKRASGSLGISEGVSGQMPPDALLEANSQSQIPPPTSQDVLMPNGERQGREGRDRGSRRPGKVDPLCTVCKKPVVGRQGNSHFSCRS